MIDLTGNIKPIYRKIRNFKLRLKSKVNRKLNKTDYVRFQCNICGNFSHSLLKDIKARETPSCYHCGSTLRFRSIVAALSKELLGSVITLNDFPVSKSTKGIGMSDISIYSKPLEKKFSYVNTFFHKEPYLDITRPEKNMLNSADFVISSDVFEHIPQPVSIAFKNLYDILAENGVAILSVPLTPAGDTKEHFPELHDFDIIKKQGKKILVNTTTLGEKQTFNNLCFHGGGGETLEMRIFSKQALLCHIEDAGFHDITVHDKDLAEYGIIHHAHSSPVITMRK